MAGKLRITVVTDNVEHDTRLKTIWGFSALIEIDNVIVLLDTGEKE